MINKAIIIGNLGKDPEVRYSQTGGAIASFSIATTETWKKQDGTKEEKTEWHKIVAFGRLAEICGEYLSKGSKVYLEGKIQTRKWENKDGVTQYTTEIVAREMKMLTQRNGEAGSSDRANQNEEPPFPEMDDSVPF